jgi:hypothetical protein
VLTKTKDNETTSLLAALLTLTDAFCGFWAKAGDGAETARGLLVCL